jgi:hypothetical protein
MARGSESETEMRLWIQRKREIERYYGADIRH